MSATITLFPKFVPRATPVELAQIAASVEVDNVDVVIRDGFSVEPDRIEVDLPSFCASLRREGLTPDYAVTPFSAEQLAVDIDYLMLMADQGIRAFRLDYFPYRPDVRTALREAKQAIDRLSPLCSLSGIRAVVHVHHGTLISSASAAWSIVKDTPPEAIGVQLDTGNQRIEGYEDWRYAVRLLGRHLHGVGVKDVILPGQWVECGAGQVVWESLFETLQKERFRGLLNLMPFYSSDPTEIADGLRREVRFLREHLGSGEVLTLGEL